MPRIISAGLSDIYLHSNVTARFAERRDWNPALISDIPDLINVRKVYKNGPFRTY